jgi:hypothetical protein
VRFLYLSLLACMTSPALAQGLEVAPLFGTQFRYEQQTSDRLLGTDDAFVMRARPGVAVDDGSWSLVAEGDAAVAMRRTAREKAGDTSATTGASPPESLQLNQLRLRYTGLAGTEISVGRQPLTLAGNIAGDRDGEQTFDAARVRWSWLPGLNADVAYAWGSRSLWAREQDGLVPETVAGRNLFAKLDWQNRFGTLSGYAYQVDQRHAANSDFRLINQVYGARFTGTRKLTEAVNLSYTLGYNRQDGALSAASTTAPTYWLVGTKIDLGELSSTQTNYRRFAANGIAFRNGDELSLATTATVGRINLGARFTDFRPVNSSVPLQDMRVTMGLIF